MATPYTHSRRWNRQALDSITGLPYGLQVGSQNIEYGRGGGIQKKKLVVGNSIDQAAYAEPCVVNG